MLVQHIRYLIEQQALQIDLPEPLLQSSRAVGDDVDDLGHKRFIRRNLAIPTLDELPHDDGKEGVELEVHIVTAR